MEVNAVPLVVNKSLPTVSYEKKITKRDIMAYSAGIGAVDDVYLNDSRFNGIVAPLAYTAALEWPIFEKEEYLDLIGRNSENIYNKFVHGFQESIFYRPVRPGDDLLISGRIVQARPTRAGALLVTKLSVSDKKNHEVLSESWFGSMYMKTPLVTDRFEDSTQQSELPGNFNKDDPGFDREISLKIPKEQAHIYTECSGIWNPVHTEKEFAIASGLNDIILHGTCTWAKSMQAIIAAIGRSESEIPFIKFGARFTSFVVPGSDVLIKYREVSDGKIEFMVLNAEGNVALN